MYGGFKQLMLSSKSFNSLECIHSASKCIGMMKAKEHMKCGDMTMTSFFSCYISITFSIVGFFVILYTSFLLLRIRNFFNLGVLFLRITINYMTLKKTNLNRSHVIFTDWMPTAKKAIIRRPRKKS